MKPKKKLLILGAGLYQVPLIEQALDMNLEVHVASTIGDYPGIQIAQYFHPVHISDDDAVLNLAHQIEIDGIISTATDICMPSMGRVVDELSLIGNGYDTSIACMDKSVMKNRFSTHNVRTAKYKIVEAPARDFQEVLAGRADAHITSNVEAYKLVAKYPEMMIVPVSAPKAPTPIAMLLPQGDQVWINYINTWIALKTERGFFDELGRKWQLSD